MPRVASLMLLGFGLLVLLAAPSTAQYPTQQSAPRWGDRPASAPQIPWTGGTTAAKPIEQPRLLPSAYQPIQRGPQTPDMIRQVAAQQPLPLPITPQPAEGAGPLGGKKLPPILTGAASLGLVLGLFLLVVWSVRRGMPKGAGLLPTEAVEVLGRAPIAGRQDVHLVRCGNKLVLLSVSATGVETLTEISDPQEVDRMYELCRQSAVPASAWQQLVGRLGNFAPGVDVHGNRPDQIDLRHLEVGGQPRA